MGLKLKAEGHSLLLVQLLLLMCVATCWCQQRSPFSLQAAVDELHRQEYPLNAPPGQQSYFLPGALGSSADQDYWDEDAVYTYNLKKPRTRLNKQLAKYLERENYIADHGGLTLGPFGGYEFDVDSNKLVIPHYQDDRKRSSVFRERSSLYDDIPASLFREREIQQSNTDNTELADQFLHEIDKAQEHERQDRYKEALRNLWEKYQQQENQIEGDIYEEQKKRMRMPPYYMLMQKKRSYPVLPWLPYNADRKKRFPVSKRSANHAATNDSPSLASLDKTDENVERELSELFGSDSDEKKKRSINSSHSKPATIHAPASEPQPTTTDMRLELESSTQNKSTEETVKRTAAPQAAHSEHNLKEHKHRKRSNHGTSHESHEDEGEEEEEDSEGEHDSEEEDEEHDSQHGHDHEDHTDDDEEEAKRKKKRGAKASKKKRNAETLKRTIEDYNVMRSKKSFDWSNYFGLDRKKKAFPIVNNNKYDEIEKRSANEDRSAEELNKKKKRKLDPAKLDNMNKKLQAIEDFIINETIKYTGAHEGVEDPEEIQRLKDRVLSRLATAYSLEKMRRALEKLRQSVDSENHLMRNIIEPDNDNSNEMSALEAIKKDKSTAKLQNLNSDDDDEDSMKKKMKKSNGYSRYPDVENEFGGIEDTLQSPNRYETLNDAYLGNKNYILGTNQCPIIESMAERCRGVDLLSGDVNQKLLPLCGVHQLCYLCGTSQIACDYQYLTEADLICGNNNNECQAAARSVLMILRGTPGPQLGPRECLKNPCLYGAMREIGL